MKTLFVINKHSFVSLITNSSSELFVCDTKKTLDAVKDILVEFLNTHNKLQDSNYNFESCFQEPLIADYSFDYDKFPENLRAEYEKYHHRPGDWNYSYNTDPEKNRLDEEARKFAEKFNIGEKDLYIKDKKEYDRRMGLYNAERNKLFFDINKAEFSAEYNLFLYLIEHGDFQNSQIVKVKRAMKKAVNEKTFEVQDWLMNDLKDKQLVAAENTFSLCMSYGITIEKGNILIYSNGDNSIPWPIQEQVESYLGTRHHLG
jgi:hypothetical protein